MRVERKGTIVVVGVAVVSAGAILLATLVLGLTQDLPFGWFSREPTETLGGHPLTGFQSTLGVLAMSASGTVILFACGVTRGALPPRAGSFLLATGLLSWLVAIDDLFMLHDHLGYRLAVWGGERWVYVAYFMLGATYVARYRHILFEREDRLILVAGGFLIASVFVDQTDSMIESVIGPEWRIFIEDGLKLFGIACWTAALLLHSARAIERTRGATVPGAGQLGPHQGAEPNT